MKIAPDKRLHLAAGLAVALVVLLVTGSGELACVAAIAAGAAKELYDLGNRDRHTPDLWDFIATAAPGCVILLAVVMWQAFGSGGVRGSEVAQAHHASQFRA